MRTKLQKKNNKTKIKPGKIMPSSTFLLFVMGLVFFFFSFVLCNKLLLDVVWNEFVRSELC